MDFYSRVVGLEPVRFAEFEAGDAPFPSVRVSADSIIDLMPLDMATGTTASVADGSAGHRLNHLCLALSKAECDALDQRLQAEGVAIGARLSNSFGAQGWAPKAFYFSDPDGNVVEARHYD
ncbi:Catechol 2,3-dioxygenase or other lactoylglutathione lyase family enzyme [Mycobacterium rhizamassiliense]|uniref:Catechol 2,3-dioxygenase or other lactoylglutathione lyase family enzyme n=2 Tax=Mycobacterium rhizamassiliense TaxID=1841860 RepID=A0A2U3NRV3_9MYCO|nr:Catechol 2,3-dioxygenase or other lactoylglutathione lyase family enzyme [Mycobacterium rhizamassiliense]